MKDNADYHVTKVLEDRTKKKNVTGVLKEQLITVAVKQNGVVTERLKLRRITYKTQEGRVYVFITNNFTLPAIRSLPYTKTDVWGLKRDVKLCK